LLKNLGVLLVGIIGALYLLNPAAGIFELIPDNLPLIGNLDEAAASALLIAALRYFGLDIVRFLGVRVDKKTSGNPPPGK
jgi:uncharacterized membrane protein YkvA (DUF1232 family)